MRRADRLGALPSKAAAPLLAVLLALPLGLNVFAPGALANHSASSPSRFATLPDPYEVKVTSSQVLAIPCDVTATAGLSWYRPGHIISFDEKGQPKPFARVPPLAGGCPKPLKLAISPGLGGFSKGHVFVALGGRIFSAPGKGCPNGDDSCWTELEIEPPIPNGTAVWLTFDENGSFDNDLIAAVDLRGQDNADEGGLFRIESDGKSARIGSPFAGILGQPAVAPDSFQPYGGFLLLPHAHGSPGIRFISPTGAQDDYVFFYPPYEPPDDPPNGTPYEGVRFVPSDHCEFGDSTGLVAGDNKRGFFFQGSRSSANKADDQIRKFSLSDFSDPQGNVKSGHALITRSSGGTPPEHQGMLLLEPNGTKYPEVSHFHNDSAVQYEGGDFADCPDPWSVEVSNDSTREPNPGETSNLSFRITISPAPSTDIPIHFETKNGSAIEGADYRRPDKDSFTFTSSNTSVEIDVSVLGDRETERDERFFLEITDPARPGILLARGVGTILDDEDSAPVIPSPPPGPVVEPFKEVISEAPPAEIPNVNSPVPPKPGPAPIGSAAPAANVPPPAPPAGAPAPTAGPAPGAAPGPGPAAVPGSSPIAAVAPGPVAAPQVIPGVAGSREDKVVAAPESDYAMVAALPEGNGLSLMLSGGGITFLFVAACVIRRSREEQTQNRPCPSLI